MSHRLGSLITPATAQPIGPGNGVEVSSGTWRVTFSPPPHTTGTKFLILHFTAAVFGAGDKIEVKLVYDTDTFDSSSGPDFWSRPIKGNSAEVDFTDGGSGTGHASLSQYGQGEGLQGAGATNANGDLFLIDLEGDPSLPFQDPTFFNTAGICPSGALPSWENVAGLPAGVMRETARSVGIIVDASFKYTKVSSCSAALIDTDLILTAGHCVTDAFGIPSGSFTLDFQTDSSGKYPPGYSPKFHKLKKLVKSGFAVPGTGAGASTGSGLDYAIIQIEIPATGLGVPPLPIQSTLPSIGDELFVIHHPRGATKKVSRKPTDPSEVKDILEDGELGYASGRVIEYACDSDNGSSGSPVFEAAGRIVAVNDWAPGSCDNQGRLRSTSCRTF